MPRKIIIELDNEEAYFLLSIAFDKGRDDITHKINKAIFDREQGNFFQCSACHEEVPPCQSSLTA